MIQPHIPLTLDTLEDHMIFVEGGEFRMGGESGYEDSKPEHLVHLDNFYLCRYPVTQALWKTVMDTNPEELAFPHPQRPVEGISWYDAVEFCNRLSKYFGYSLTYIINKDRSDPNNQNILDEFNWSVSLIKNSNGFRLPFEGEWEYAARGGRYLNSSEFPGSSNPGEVAWRYNNSQDISQPIGLRLPNSLGLFDMSGDVWEWIWDWYEKRYYEYCFQKGTIINPSGPDKGSKRVIRGGSWYNIEDENFQVNCRYDNVPFDRDYVIGFRLCRHE